MIVPTRAPLGRPVEILLVEDNYGDVVLTREAFKSAPIPYTISVASDGEQALRMLRREAPHTDQTRPDVILLDLNLPRKQGSEVIEEMSRDSAMSRIPVVILTGSEVDPQKNYTVRAKSYLLKPVNIENVQSIFALIVDDDALRIVEPQEDFAPSATDTETETELELSEFSYIVSHDLAAPLRHVAAFSALLIRDLGPGASSDQVAFCNQIHRATQKCQSMLNELLAFSRAQRALMAIEVCDATLLMEVARLQLSGEVQAAGADITIDRLGTAAMDSALMTLVFKHALSNAIKFRYTGGAVKVDVRAVQAAAPGAWTVRIADNGPGVALERQEKLFRMFYQDEPEGAFEGVGSGLAISQLILRRHGGSIRFVAAEQGACLEISLPGASSLQGTQTAAE